MVSNNDKAIKWTDKQIEDAKNDFRVFLFMVWRAIGLPAPTERQYEIADTLQDKPSNSLLIEGFRGIAKSYITCAYVVWRLWKDRNLKVLVVSASRDKVMENAKFIRRIIANEFLPFLHEMDPNNIQVKKRKSGPRIKGLDTQIAFDVAGCKPAIAPSVKVVGINGQMTGSRAALIVADDVEIPNNSGTALKREQLLAKTNEFEDILTPGGEIIYLGTPQTEASIYEQLKQKGYACRIWPFLYPNQQELAFYGDALAPSIKNKAESNNLYWAGRCTEPGRFSAKDVERRKRYGKTRFMLQYMLNTNLSDMEHYPLKTADMIITNLSSYEASNVWAWDSNRDNLIDLPNVGIQDFYYKEAYKSDAKTRYQQVIVVVDPSGRGRDETAYAVLAYLNGYIFLLDSGGFSSCAGYSTETITAIVQKALFFKANKIYVESNFGDGMYTQLMLPIVNRIYPCPVEEIKNYKQKEQRIIDTIEPILLHHKLIVSSNVIVSDYATYETAPDKSLIYQMTRLTSERGSLAHDDRLDALAMGIEAFKPKMSVDSIKNSYEEDSNELNEIMEFGIREAAERKMMRETNDVKVKRFINSTWNDGKRPNMLQNMRGR